MIKFNITEHSDDIQRVIDQIKASGLTDVEVNIMQAAPSTCAVPRKRLYQIAKIMDAMIDGKKLGLSKKELVELLIAEDGNLGASSASAYISSASGAGVLEKTIHGYVLSASARKELLGDE